MQEVYLAVGIRSGRGFVQQPALVAGGCHEAAPERGGIARARFLHGVIDRRRHGRGRIRFRQQACQSSCCRQLVQK